MQCEEGEAIKNKNKVLTLSALVAGIHMNCKYIYLSLRCVKYLVLKGLLFNYKTSWKLLYENSSCLISDSFI